jgi:hypothetical protein
MFEAYAATLRTFRKNAAADMTNKNISIDRTDNKDETVCKSRPLVVPALMSPTERSQ